jgi:hypothetical protein
MMAKFEVRIFKQYSNLFEVVAKVESDEVDDAISILENRVDTDVSPFLGQVWEIEPEERLHYEIDN